MTLRTVQGHAQFQAEAARIAQVREEMGAVAPEKPTWRKVALLWAARKGWPIFVSLGSAAAFACGVPSWGYGLLIGWAIGTVLS